MKLKEKLAREATDRFGYPKSLLCEGLFLEGFEKAREMAYEEVWNHDSRCGDLGCAAVMLKKIGEEEV